VAFIGYPFLLPRDLFRYSFFRSKPCDKVLRRLWPETSGEDAVSLIDREIVDARLATLHQARRRKLPEFGAVGAMPLPMNVTPLIMKLDRYAIVPERPKSFLNL